METELNRCIQPDAIVFAKLKNDPYWPAYVDYETLENGERKVVERRTDEGTKEIHVIFLNGYTSDWVPVDGIKDFTEINERKLLSSISILDDDTQKVWKGAVDEGNDRREEGKWCEPRVQLSRNRLEPVDIDKIREGDLLIVRFDGYPDWPAQVQAVNEPGQKYHGRWRRGRDIHVKFLNDDCTAWMRKDKITDYSLTKQINCKVRENNVKYEQLKGAFNEAEEILEERDEK